MRWLRANGQEVIELNAVGDNEMALPLYEGVGFAVVHRHLGYRYDLNEEQPS
jgi:ribosomal protein S18 acetylase RimI-like enzyme